MIGRVKSSWPWVLLVLGLPLAAFGLLLPPNEYESWGGSGVDCDGPFLLAFALPALAIYLVCSIALSRRTVLARSWPAAIAALFCLALVLALGANGLSAINELRRPDHRASCA